MDPGDLELRIYPDPVLFERARRIERVDNAVRTAAREMFRIMYEHGGVGLAGPQVGWLRRIFVANVTGDPEQAGEERVFVNPALRPIAEPVLLEEGCLSLPEIRAEVLRPAAVEIEALGLDGKPLRERHDGLLGRCIQHETDHLDGILFLARLPITARLALRGVLKELQRKYKEKRRAG